MLPARESNEKMLIWKIIIFFLVMARGIILVAALPGSPVLPLHLVCAIPTEFLEVREPLLPILSVFFTAEEMHRGYSGEVDGGRWIARMVPCPISGRT
jgi:hypothetical protein